MRFLDFGCCANLANYRLDKWPSKYYGVDISPKLISAMKGFVKRRKLSIGELYISEISDLPFKDNFFDIAAVIGVLEYYGGEYVKKALDEIYRVLKDGGKIVIDMPNLKHPDVNKMFKLEKFLGRSRLKVVSEEKFRKLLKGKFEIVKVDTSSVMTVYFLKRLKVLGEIL